ncbi:MAG TPA: carboxypeptidase regulatory-like domain-containing protein [Pyrinomonadaceae bacterium]|jgi:hypothetical protein|nr:carboxypeptidase regulatory-like domain-containing protein [Pyrinomonadaceae bacterium]
MKNSLHAFGFRLLMSTLLISLLLFSIHSAGSTKGAKMPGSWQQNKPTYMRVVEHGTLTGTISFEGEVPKRRFIDMSADGICPQLNPKAQTEDVMVTDGKLANVFVYVKSGNALDAYQFETPVTEAVLDHKRCRMSPHMLGIQVGQPLKILNSDQTHHNSHPVPRDNQEWNRTQGPGAPPFVVQFAKPEIIPFKDNQHPWEKAYVGVFAHPFFAVSGKDGSYRIEGLPAGSYTIVAWHERFGEKTMQITIAPYENRKLDFIFEPEK